MLNDQSRRYLLIPAALLVLAVLPMPYGFYTLVRIVVTLAAAFMAYTTYLQNSSLDWKVIALGFIAILFNPVIQISLSRTIWLPIDLLCAALFVYLAFGKSKAFEA